MKNKFNIFAPVLAVILLFAPVSANETGSEIKKNIEDTAKAVRDEINAQPAKAMNWLEQFQAWLVEVQAQGKASIDEIKAKKEEFKEAAKKTGKFIEEEKEFLEDASKDISEEIKDILD